nr:ribonuclease H-like domain-containing protein [Tanacetum cinerariifolium]
MRIVGVVQVVAPTTAEQRLAKKNELKARGTLLMALPDKHQLKFNIHKDAKSLMEAIEKRFSGNKETKKVQKTLLKQQYENFSGTSSESLDQIHDRLQKLISQLEILEWKTHTLIWRNKADLEEHSLDDLFNNLKIYEAEVNGSSLSIQNTQNIASVSSNNTDSINESVIAAPSISAASSKATSNSPQLDNEDLKQINPDDLEEMDLKWHVAMLTMRARRFLKRAGRNLGANGTDTIGFDMFKVECYNCHRRGHFARECRSPRDNSFQADEEPTNYALMAYTSLGSSSSLGSDNEVAPCSKGCSKAFATLQTHYDNLIVEFRKSQLDVLPYKTSLESVEARLVVYQKNETVFEEDIKLLKLDVMLRDNAMAELRKKFEKAEKEKNSLKLTLDKFQTSSKNLSKLLESQVSDKTGLGFDSQVFNCQVSGCEELHSHESDNIVPKNPENDRYKIGKGYHAVPPPYTRTFLPPKLDLVITDDPNREPSFVTSTEHVKSSRESVKKVEHHKQASNLRTNTHKSRGHKNNWNNKACFVCGSLNHLIKDCDYYEKQMVQKHVWNSAMRVNHQNSVRMIHPHLNRNVVPTTVLTRSKLVSLNTARHVPTAVTQSTVKSTWSVKHVVNKAHSPVRRVTRVMLKKPQHTGCGNQNGNPQQALKDKGIIDSGCSRHMTRNISFLSKFEEIDGGYVAFRGNPKGGKIYGKGKIKTGKLDFDDVYFVKELKFNLFSVLQMCDKKNNVLFTNTEYVVLSSNYKLPDENHVLLRVPREKNMYNVDLKNIVPSGGLTCLFAKATLDESNLWHRRLGHINFKTMNKLVNGNLVRGLPSKIFENNHTCVACKKGKQHKASWIKREFNVAMTPQQNKVTEKKNRTLIEAARTMLADSLLPIPFWVETVNIAYYVKNRVLVTKPYNKTPYELLLGKSPSIGFMRPFRCPVTILNTLDPLGKFDGKADEGFLVGYSVNRKAFRVFNSRTRNVQETLHINFLENKPNIAGTGPKWLFDIDTLTMSMNYQPVVAENQPNDNASIKENLDVDPHNTYDDVADAAFDVKENENGVHVFSNGSDKTANQKHDEKAKRDDNRKSHVDLLTGVRDLRAEFEEFSFNSFNRVNAVSTPVNAVGPNLTNSFNSFNTASLSVNVVSPNFRIAGKSLFMDLFKYPDDPDMPELEDIVYSDDEEDALVDLPKGKRAIGSKWVFRNKKDERRIVIKNKARLVAHGHTQEEGIDYDEVFPHVARIKDIRLFLPYASFMGFMVYQMDVKSAFLYETIKEEVYVCQPPGFEDPDYPDKVYKVVKALYGLHQAPRAWGRTGQDAPFFVFARGGLQVKQKDDGIFISQDKYVAKILRKFSFTDVKSASTPIKTEKPLLKDPDGEDVDVHIYRSQVNAVEGITINNSIDDLNHLHLQTFSRETDQTLNPTSNFSLLITTQKNTMAPLTFADTHNMVAFLSTSNAIKKVNDVVQLHALIDGKKVVVSEAIIRRDLHLNDVDGVECFPNAEIFKELARMGYEKPPPKLTFYKAFFSAQWKFLIHMLVYMVRNVDSPSKFLMYPRFLQVVMDHQVDDMTTHNTRYTSLALTQKVFANMRRVGKGLSGVETPLFDSMLHQPTTPHESSMPLLTTLMETYATLSQKVVALEKDKYSQALEILQLKKRVKNLERKKKSKSSGLKRLRRVGEIAAIDADKGITFVDVEIDEETLFKPDKDVQETKKKRVADETLLQESFKKLRAAEVSGSESTQEIPSNDPKEITEQDVQNMLEIIPVPKFKVEALQVKYPIIDWEIHTKGFDREDLFALWNLVKEKFSSVVPSKDKEKALWKLYSDYGVHHVSSTRGHEIFMLIEKDYPLSNAVMILMLSEKLQAEEDNEMARDLVMKIFMEANKPRSESLDTSF